MRQSKILLLMLLLLIACKKDNGDISISGFLLTDVVGNVITNIGNVDDDWKLSAASSLGAREKAFLEFTDTIGLAHTTAGNVEVLPAYPNPVKYSTRLTVNADDSVLLKVVVVNRKGTVLVSHEKKFRGYYTVQFDMTDRTKFPASGAFRIYYGFSAEGDPLFKVGHGDIKVCESTDISQCF